MSSPEHGRQQVCSVMANTVELRDSSFHMVDSEKTHRDWLPRSSGLVIDGVTAPACNSLEAPKRLLRLECRKSQVPPRLVAPSQAAATRLSRDQSARRAVNSD